MAEKVHEIHFNLFSDLAYSIVKYAMIHYNHPYEVSSDSLSILPNGELVYSDNRTYIDFSNVREVLKARRAIGKAVRNFLHGTARELRVPDAYSLTTAAVRELSDDIKHKVVDIVEPHKDASYYGQAADKMIPLKDFKVTLEQLAYVIDIIGFYKDRKKVEEEYPSCTKDVVNGEVRDPFITCAIDTLRQQIVEMSLKEKEELQNAYKEYQNKEKMIRESWRQKTDALWAQVEELKKATC